MSTILRTIWHCDRCHHEWYSKEKPFRCSKCKKKIWDMTANTDGDTIASPIVTVEQEPKTSDSLTNEEILRRWRELGM